MMLALMLLTASTAGAQEAISGLTYNTEGGYYEIPDAAALNALADYVNAGNDASWKTFKQTANITFSHSSDWNDASSKESNFNGIGNDTKPFKGSYYGQGFTISGVRMYVRNTEVGLFRYARNATIDGIVLTDSRITGGTVTGGIAGRTYKDGGNCIVNNCHVRSNVLIHIYTDEEEVNYQGGIVGHNTTGCEVTNCTSAVTITGGSQSQFFGGIVGDNSGIMRNNIAIGVTIGNIKKYYGAIVGTKGNYGVLSNNYYYDCTVKGLTSNIGCNGADIAGAFNASPDHFTASGSEYTIKTATGWNVFCECLNHNDRYSRFSGKTVKLEANIEVSRMAGSDSHDFCGTFDGQGHTLTFNYGTSDAYSNEEYIAPFHYVSTVTTNNVETPAAIKDLHVAGDIFTSAKYAAGLIAQHWGTVNVENCRNSMVIHSSVSGEGTHGGFEAMNIGTLNIKGCVFDGKLLTTNGTTNCGGFVAWHYGGTTNISNSLYAPAALEEGETEVGTDTSYPSATFLRNVNNPNITNCYYTRALGTAQGKQIYSITAGENMTSLDISGSAATAYSVSDISFYANNSGLKYGNTCYACNGDNVALTLSHTTVPAGYSFSNYAVSAGSLSGTTLTMPNQDVTVSAPYTLNTYTITYNLAGGSVAGANPTTFSVESETFTLINPTRTGFIFSGWTGSNGNTPQTTVTIAKGSTENRTYTANWTPDAAHFSVSGNEYTIHTAEGWGVFCDALQDNANYNRFSGKTVKLDANIGTAQDPITRMAGSGTNPFCGNFNGGGNKLTFSATAADNYCAPFANVQGGSTEAAAITISNLNVKTTITAADYRHTAGLIALQSGHVNVSGCNATVTISSSKGTNNPTDLYPAGLVSQAFSGNDGTLTVSGCTATGTISTDGKYAAGLVGIVQGAASISDCVSSVTINSSIKGDGTHGGIVAVVTGSGTITGSVFNGKLLTVNTGETATGNCAGFVAWGNGTISNCLYAPAAIEGDEAEVVAGTGDYPSGTFYRGTAPTVTNCYYTRALGTPLQGKAPRTVTAGDNVTIGAVSPVGSPVENGTYAVSGITAYTKGITRTVGQSTTFYYGSGDAVNLTLSHADRTGYTFSCYAASNDGTLTGTENPYTLTMPDADVTINATWTPITYSITYHPNDGEFTTDKNSFTIESETITLDVPTRTGYTFGGWYDNSALTGNAVTTIAHGSTGDVELWAKWTPITYSITYNAGEGATFSTDKNSFTIESETITLDVPTRKGYTFGGWYNNSALTGNAVTTIAHGSTGDVELWAKWTSNTYTVHFDGNGATGGSMDNQTFTYDAAQNLTANAFTRAFIVTYSYNEATGGNNDATATATATFNGWATTADGTVAYTNQQSVRNLAATGTVNLYANWTDGNVTLPTPTKTGYTFGGWYSDAGLTASVGAAGASYTPSANITLYAKWTPITYTITYDLDGGTVATANPTTYNIETETFTLTNPTKPGYFFAGWTGSNGSTPQPTVTIEQGSIENRTYTANYEDFFSVGGLTFRNTSGTEVKVTVCNSNLTAVTIPATVTYKEATYPVTAIDVDAFNGCTALKFIILNASTPPSLGSGAFNSCNALTDIYVPAGSTETYKTATNWQSYADKIQGCDGICGETVLWTYNSDSKTLTIFGIGAMANYDFGDDQPWDNYRDNIMTVVIRDGVTSIGNYAFSYCTGLTTVFMEATTPPTLGDYTFNGCRTLFGICVPANKEGDYKNANGWSAYADKIFVIDGTCGDGVYWSYNSTGKVLSIFGGGAMADLSSGQPWASYRNDITMVAIGDGVTTIGKMAFNNCTGLTTFTIPASVTSIGGSAFSGCSSLATVFMLATTPPTLNSGVFDNCSALTAIYVPTGTAETYKTATNWSAYADKIVAFDGRCGDNVYYSYDSDSKTLTIFGKGAMANYNFWGDLPWYCDEFTTLNILDGVTTIGEYAFVFCSSLTTVNIPASVMTIGEGAFVFCSSLTTVNIPASVTTIGYGAFQYCTGLTSITIPVSVTSIADQVFANCSSLTSINIPAGVTSIGNSAFAGCTGLNAFTVDNGNTAFVSEDGVLFNKAKTTLIQYPAGNSRAAYTIPNSVTSIGGGAFNSCTGLTSITIPASVTSIGDVAFQSCTGLTSIEIPASVTTIGDWVFSSCTGLTSVEIPANVTSIGEGAFLSCTSLTSITIPASVTSIGNHAFDGCTGLTSVDIPASVTTIGQNAFTFCTGLTSITIPASVTSIGGRAFQNCTGLTTVFMQAATPPTLDYGAFNDCSALTAIYVPTGTAEAYKAATNWSEYEAKIQENDIVIALADNADNSSLIAGVNGLTLSVTLAGRTLYKDGDWNTLCLPFDVSITSGTLSGDNVVAMTLNSTTSNLNDGTLTLNFDAVATTGEQAGLIPAGTPFIIKWASKESPATNLVNPVFSGMTIDNSAEAIARKTVTFGGVSFVGTYNPVIIPSGGDNTKLYLGANNTLYWPNDAMTIGAFRAYFHVSGAAGVRQFVLNFDGDGEAQGIKEIDDLPIYDLRFEAGAWYTIDGVKLDGKPTKKGLYIHGDRKVVVK